MTNKSDIALSVRGLSKSYTIAHNDAKHSTAAEVLLHRLKNPRQRTEMETFWALKDVAFDVQKGDVVGIIGRNGAGKSTLLKVLSRVVEPSSGKILLNGRVGSLLEVGTGFHPELTGRENIYLNGAILGMSKREITHHFDAIVDFAGTEQFLDTPVKRYSSGMYVRLAFAVAAHLNPEILIVDEVLAVGDATFQKKCLGKMQDVAQQEGRTVIFVSHNMTAVQSLCTHAIMLQNGRLAWDGNVAQAISLYQAGAVSSVSTVIPGQENLADRVNKYLPEKAIIQNAIIRNARGEITDKVSMGGEMTLTIDVKGFSEYPGAMIGVKILSDNDQWLVGLNTEMKLPHVVYPRQLEEKVILHIPNIPFVPGKYWFEIGVDQKSVQTLDYVERAISFEVMEADVYGTGYRVEAGVMYLNAEWYINQAPTFSATQELAQSR